MAGEKKHAEIEWMGGIATMPAYVSGEGEPYRPELLLWMSDDGLILGTTMARPGEVLASAADHLRATIQEPMIGAPSAPKRVRVASPELADALRAAHPRIEIVCAPTPEIDATVAAMSERMDASADDAGDSYLTPEIDAAAMASFFRAASRLFRAKPWKVVPDGESLFSVTIEKLDLRDAAACVIGQMGESFGVVLFSDFSSFDAFTSAAAGRKRGNSAKVPPTLALNFERRADLSPLLRKEIAAHRWEVAGASAYPWLVAMDADLVTRPPTPGELTLFEALALALAEVIADEPALLSAWSGGPAYTRTLSVATHAGAIEVALGASPLPVAPLRPVSEVLAGLALLEKAAKDGKKLDDELRRELEDELMSAFVESPEAESLKNGESCALVMNLAADTFGVTVATLVFDIIPREVSADPADAPQIVSELRALYAFLKREPGLPEADACLGVLEGDAVKELEAALSDKSRFGMAKARFMAAREPAAKPARSGSAASQTKKNQRKAASNARKKNR